MNKRKNPITIIAICGILLFASCNSMPEFLKSKPTDDPFSVDPSIIPPNVNEPQDEYIQYDTITNDVSTPILEPSPQVFATNTDCESYWMNRIMLQEYQDLNEVYGRYRKTFTRNAVQQMLNYSNKYSKDVFDKNRASLCDRYEKLKLNWYYRSHANDAMIIDTAGVITFVTVTQLNKKK